jgi:Calcineurin-like phosphoesterase
MRSGRLSDVSWLSLALSIAPACQFEASEPARSHVSAPGPRAGGPDVAGEQRTSESARTALDTGSARPRPHAASRVRLPSAADRVAPPVLSPALSRPAAARVVAIGDLHGDLVSARAALALAGAIDASDSWIGGELVLVQTGDVLDRGDEDRQILDLLDRLHGEAEAAGGELIELSGNHEVMNVQLNFSYVTPGGFTAFDGGIGRELAFRPGGEYATRLAHYPIVMKVGDTVFVHGGVLPKHVVYGLDRMNAEVQSWMRGELLVAPPVINDGDGLLWTRLYSSAPEYTDCEQLEEALAMLGARRMVVAHTPQLTGITTACDDRVWRIDTGMSRFYGGPVEVLEIVGEAVQVLRQVPEG